MSRDFLLNYVQFSFRNDWMQSVETSLNHNLKTEHLLSLKFKVEGKVKASNLLGFDSGLDSKPERAYFSKCNLMWPEIA